MGFRASVHTDLINFDLEFDDRQYQKDLDNLQAKAKQIMIDTIYDILKEQLADTQKYIKSETEFKHRYMANKVADSLIVEQGFTEGDTVVVGFGSDPFPDGVEGSRGGKLAQILEFGVQPFSYPFTFKTIENSQSWGSIGGGFINARAGNNQTHRGFKAIGWLDYSQAQVMPQIQRIVDAFAEAWGS